MVGRTGVILDKDLAITELTDSQEKFRVRELNRQLVILEMTISGSMYNAWYCSKKTIIGSHIVSFKEIKL